MFEKKLKSVFSILLTFSLASVMLVFNATPASASHHRSVEAYMEIDSANVLTLTVNSFWASSGTYSARIYNSTGDPTTYGTLVGSMTQSSITTRGGTSPIGTTSGIVTQTFTYDGSSLNGYYVVYGSGSADISFINSAAPSGYSYAVGFYVNNSKPNLSIGSPKVEQTVDFNVPRTVEYTASLAASSDGGSGSTITGAGSYVEITSTGQMPGDDYATNQANSGSCTNAERVSGGLWSLNSSTGAFSFPQSVTTNCANGSNVGFKFKVVDLANDPTGRIYSTRDVGFYFTTTSNCAPTLSIDGTTDGATLTLTAGSTTTVTVTATDDTSGSCDSATSVTLSFAGLPSWVTASSQESISGVASNVRRVLTLSPTSSDGLGTSRLISISATDAGSPNLGARASFTARVPSDPPTGTAGDTQVVLSWNAVTISGETVTYKIQQSTDSGANFSDVSGAGSVSGTTHTITGLTNGQAYNFRVIAIGSTSGAQTPGDYSEALTPAAASAPSAPTGLTATAGNGQVSLSWTAGSDGGAAITDYVIEYSTDNSTWSTFSDGTSTSTSATVTGLTNGTLYYFRVKATNSVGTGSASSNATATPAAPASSGGGLSTPSATPTPTPTPTVTQTPRQRRIITPNLNPSPAITPRTTPSPSASPTPNATQTPQAGSPTRPVELVRKTIEEVIEVLKPRIVDLNTLINPSRSPDPVASASASSAVSTLPTAAALAQVDVPEEEKRVADIPSSVLNNGVPEESRIIVVEETKSQVVTGDGGLLTVEAKAGDDPVPVDSRGRVQMVRENSVETEGQGMAPESEFAVYLFSDPILLGVGKTDLAGRFFASFPVEQELPLGDHTLQVVGITPTGEQRTVAMPVVIVEDVETAKTQALPETILVDQNPVQAWFESVNYLITILLILILVAFWWLFGIRRRRREED